MNNLTENQRSSIQNYKRLGIDIDVIDENTIKITQAKLINGILLNQKELHQRAREIFPEKNIIPVVFTLDLKSITKKWILSELEKYGIHKNDLIKQLAFTKEQVQKLFSETTQLDNTTKTIFFYYLLSYQQNRNIRENL